MTYSLVWCEHYYGVLLGVYELTCFPAVISFNIFMVWVCK
jgi:hypothetical protein